MTWPSSEANLSTIEHRSSAGPLRQVSTMNWTGACLGVTHSTSVLFHHALARVRRLLPPARAAQVQPLLQFSPMARSEKIVVQQSGGRDVWAALPLGIVAPLREAARTCQLAPANWPLEAYRLIRRNDLATSALKNPDMFINDGYKTRKEFINPVKPREKIGEIVAKVRSMAGETQATSEVDFIS